MKQRLLRNRPGSDAATSCAKNYKGHSLVQTSFTELPNVFLSADQRKPTTMETKPQPATEQALPNHGANLPAGPHSPGPWQRAKSRALEAFPGYRVADCFDELEPIEVVGFGPLDPFNRITSEPVELSTDIKKNTDGVLMLMKLVSPMFNFLRPHWAVVVSWMLNFVERIS